MKVIRFLGYLLILLAVVPISGLLTFGSWRQAIEYTKAWGRAIGWLLLAAGVFALILFPFIPD